MGQELINYIKNIKGNILVVGLQNEKIIKEINKNDNIDVCYLLQKNKLFTNKVKVINNKKLKKLLDKNKINEIICNYYSNKDIYNSIPGKFYLNGKLYLYGYMTKYEIEEIKEDCSYYTKYIDVIDNNNDTLLIIGSLINKKESKDEIDRIYGTFGVINGIIDFIISLIK